MIDTGGGGLAMSRGAGDTSHASHHNTQTDPIAPSSSKWSIHPNQIIYSHDPIPVLYFSSTASTP